ncbi:reverse transcriptase domain-containing protein, partial [Klebsiella pneumoniae]|uniref:reverse transcriptase domain-containing protein n=1 Tax=Klebsiella pneumoniae TaxID=573 RepID=UPI003EB9C587
MDLEKAYDRIDRDGMWHMLSLYGVGGKLLKGVKSFYVDSRACVRVGSGVSDWFPVKVGLRQGCVMAPWLFNPYTAGVEFSRHPITRAKPRVSSFLD